MEVRETGKISQTRASEEKVKETEQDRHWLVFSDRVLNFNESSLPEPNTPSSLESILPTRKMLMLLRCLMSRWTRLMATFTGQRSWQGLL